MGQTRRGQLDGGKARKMRVHALEFSVVGAPAGGMDETPGDAGNEESVRDHELGY